jgi:hypothetical protein
MRIEDCAHQDGVLVRIEPHELHCGHGKTVPYACTAGVVLHNGKIDVWTPAADKPSGYKRAAQNLLESVQRAGLWPTRYACTYSGCEEVYKSFTAEQRSRVDSVAAKWAADDIAAWEKHWRTTIDDDTKDTLTSRAFADSVETKARTLRLPAWYAPTPKDTSAADQKPGQVGQVFLLPEHRAKGEVNT